MWKRHAPAERHKAELSGTSCYHFQLLIRRNDTQIGWTIAAVPPANDENFDMRTLARLAVWGAAAMLALLIAVFTTRSDFGARRIALAFGTATGSTPAPRAAPAPTASLARGNETEQDVRRLTESLRSLSTDRDRLLARVTVLERNFEDMTGSIGRAATTAPASTPPITLPAGPSITSTITAPLQMPAPRERIGAAQPAAPAAFTQPESLVETVPSDMVSTRTDFGVDIGGGPSVASLRTAWNAARRNHAGLLEGLRPVVAIRDGGKSGSVELRLIIGPLSNAAAAARLCASLAASGLSCQPTIFDGQRLALR